MIEGLRVLEIFVKGLKGTVNDEVDSKLEEFIACLKRANEIMNELADVEVKLSGDCDHDVADCCNCNGDCAELCRTSD